jgi:hypothetical protein
MVIYLLTAIGLTTGGSSTVHIYTNNTLKKYTQNGTNITITIHKVHNYIEAYKT